MLLHMKSFYIQTQNQPAYLSDDDLYTQSPFLYEMSQNDLQEKAIYCHPHQNSQ